MKPIRKLLAANRSEIAIRVFRSAHELGLRTVAIYSHEDRFGLHRFKADEAYQVGTPGQPIKSYLDIDSIIRLAKSIGVDAIHPGYGFLSENADFARACEGAGIIFVGPKPEILDQLGDKVSARRIAAKAGVPVLSGSEDPVTDMKAASELALKLGYPVMVKASMGGGGRGMRVVRSADQLEEAITSAQREAGSAFGVTDVFLEKFVTRARHLEVQLLGDSHGNLAHLFERDCSLQRRHQKIVELAPAPNLDEKTRSELLESAVSIGKAVGLNNAATVEFLFDVDTGKFYFIEVNPRIQVEHTVTEMVTGRDIVRSQILVSQGVPLSDPEIDLGDQSKVTFKGFAVQCRVTTEDPANGFAPDYGRLTAYRSAGGLGIRLDTAVASQGAVVTPFFDSMLVKVTAYGLRFRDAAKKMERALQEFRIRGVKTNIPFLINVVTHERFLNGEATTRFIDETPELFQFTARKDRATKLLRYLADVTVNGHTEVKNPQTVVAAPQAPSVHVPPAGGEAPPKGTRDRLKELGPAKFCEWVKNEKRLLVTDTTFRDAHQSLLATRMRTYDMLQVAPRYARVHADLFSLEMWGGATFDTSMRFLNESPWDRLTQMRQRIPNVLFQMLLRASNAVGYTNYPDNVVKTFVNESASAGVDVFRVFDSLNWVPNMRVACEAVVETGAICEAALCYTGDFLNPSRQKYSLKYYTDLAKELVKLGAHIIAIKDMAGLLKPYAAKQLVRALKQEVGVPIHFHTHDTAGGQLASYLMAADEGVDVVDCASAPFSGMTSQPSINALAEAARFTDRDTGLSFDDLQETANYWEGVRRFYAPFESGQLAPSAEVYRHEMPGGQYTNLMKQAQSLGLGERWHEVGKVYAEVNQLFGDIVKVTPSSKVVGDMTLFLMANNLEPSEVLNPDRELAFPDSVIDFFAGKLGQPPGGFPPELKQRILKGRSSTEDRPGATLPPADFEATKKSLEALSVKAGDREAVTSLLYEKVYADYVKHVQEYSDTSVLPTRAFFQGMTPGEEIEVTIEAGKTLVIRYQTHGDADENGLVTVFFELNGQPREVTILDRKVIEAGGGLKQRPKAEAGNKLHIGSPMPGAVGAITIAAGDQVAPGQKLMILEAMKMETAITSERAGVVAEVLVKAGTQVQGGDLLVRLEG